MDAVRRWEDSELSSQSATEKPAMVMITRKKLVPLGEAAGGATQLLNAQVVRRENGAHDLESAIKILGLNFGLSASFPLMIRRVLLLKQYVQHLQCKCGL